MRRKSQRRKLWQDSCTPILSTLRRYCEQLETASNRLTARVETKAGARSGVDYERFARLLGPVRIAIRLIRISNSSLIQKTLQRALAVIKPSSGHRVFCRQSFHPATALAQPKTIKAVPSWLSARLYRFQRMRPSYSSPNRDRDSRFFRYHRQLPSSAWVPGFCQRVVYMQRQQGYLDEVPVEPPLSRYARTFSDDEFAVDH